MPVIPIDSDTDIEKMMTMSAWERAKRKAWNKLVRQKQEELIAKRRVDASKCRNKTEGLDMDSDTLNKIFGQEGEI